jgi:hypothetical protein
MNGRPSRLLLAVHPQQSTVARLVMLSGRVGFLADWQSRRGLLSPITVFAVIARTILVVRTSLLRIRLRVIVRTIARALLSHSSILSRPESLILADKAATRCQIPPRCKRFPGRVSCQLVTETCRLVPSAESFDGVGSRSCPCGKSCTSGSYVVLRTLGDDTPLSGGPRRSAYPSSLWAITHSVAERTPQATKCARLPRAGYTNTTRSGCITALAVCRR